MSTIEFELEGQTLKIVSQRIKDKIWCHYQGRTFVFDAQQTSKRKSSGTALTSAEPGIIKAPMPGKIIKVNITLGDEVTAGQTLMVMEAMKMEYYLKSDIDGKVTKLNCSELEQVTLGAMLAKVEIPTS